MTASGTVRVGLAFVGLAVGVSSARAQSPELIDRVLAVAAGDVIMLSDVRAGQDFGLVDVAGAADPVRAALSQLIDRALILHEVDRYAPPEPSVDALEDAFTAVRARFSTAAAFDAAMARAGMNEERLRAIVRQNLRLEAYLGQRFAVDSPERRQTILDEWVAGLRRRADVVDLYGARR